MIFLLLSLPKLLTQLHQDCTQAILSRSVATVSPVAVILRVLHNRPVSCVQQFLSKLRILCKFVSESIFHDCFLDLIPVRPQRFSSLITPIEGFIRSWSTDNIEFLGFALKLFGLKVMFITAIVEIANSKGRGIDIIELSKRFLNSIEVDRLQLLLSNFWLHIQILYKELINFRKNAFDLIITEFVKQVLYEKAQTIATPWSAQPQFIRQARNYQLYILNLH